MAQVLVAQTQAVAGSPLSGSESPGAVAGGDKINRAQAKKILKDEVDLLVQGVKTVKIISDALSQTKKGEQKQVTYTDQQGQQHQYMIGRKELNELVSQLTRRMQKLPKLAFDLSKTRRRTGPNSGFLARGQFSQPIIDFFAQVPIGPYVTGSLTLKQDRAQNKKSVPVSSSLRAQEGTRLNDYLYFTMPQINGQQNPLYGIIAPGTLTPLFALHANYAQNPDGTRQGLQVAARNPQTGQFITNPETGQPEIDAARLTASNEMRQLLRDIMVRAIRNDAIVIGTNHPQYRDVVQAKAQQLIQAIDDPQLFVDSVIIPGSPSKKQVEMFNPNYFPYAHFSKLISNGKVAADAQGGLTSDRLMQLRPQIFQVYGPLIQQDRQEWQRLVAEATTPGEREVANMRVQLYQQAVDEVPEQGVLTHQQDAVAKARAFKNQQTGKTSRSKTSGRRRQQAAGGVPVGVPGTPAVGLQQGLPGGLQVGPPGGFQTLPGLPGTIGGASNTFSGSGSSSRSPGRAGSRSPGRQ